MQFFLPHRTGISLMGEEKRLTTYTHRYTRMMKRQEGWDKDAKM